ncbi:hypothetical protein CHGG_05471 [Chaetomium globosum CBS 148.51]|uniref:G domain-containing protein n=1 Tax=Chaetomium globosum (strain ATCC 6205 / CBS 148.51 / DSM 1962 / NBRC 6347 / NRRL 1970) TaxID=306901 RepID=Q2H794_CHAGB|nr:uncharacterized protein CHGG_05471 [Chaetomium globosum CBS 148.51]EAQ88852.1 hypothetical protein CHGG_05471 [Chaetomium globosum CBS 148.51]
MLTPPSEFLSACPKFRLLVLGNPESTKRELFTKIFGVDLEKKLVDDAFSAGHDIEQELDLHGQNSRLAIHTNLNAGAGDDANYERIRDFLSSRATSSTKQEDRIHCVWYCVASEEGRSVTELEQRFFFGGLHSASPWVPLILVFTKYDEFVSQVKLDWSRGAQEQGLSKVAVSHILRDLSSKKFEKHIGQKWDEVLGGSVPRVCVSSGDEDDDVRSDEVLAEATLAALRNKSVKYAFAAAQRNSALISTRFAADTAATDYFEVDTGHARKQHGTAIADILPHFFTRAIQIFNLRDPTAALTSDPALLAHILEATFDASQHGLVAECLNTNTTTDADTNPTSLIAHLTPHERAVLLTQTLTSILLFLHRLADTQQTTTATPSGLTRAALTRQLTETHSAPTERRAVLETVESSAVFSSCTLHGQVAEVMVRAVQGAARAREGSTGGRRHAGAPRGIVVEDDSELQEISLSFVNDQGPDDVVLPSGLTLLPLT